MKKDELDTYNDNELLYMIYQKDEQAFCILLEKYEGNIQFVIRKYNRIGAYTNEDYYQLALVKFMEAINTYRENKHASFFSYYIEIAQRAFIDYYRKCKTYKGANDIYTVSLDRVVEEENAHYTIVDIVSAPKKENQLARLKELLKEYKCKLKPLENEILRLRLLGYSYKEIAQKLQISVKKVDNTLHKIRNIKTNKS